MSLHLPRARRDGTHQEAGPGEAIFIPAGFRGLFELLEAVTKTYAIVVARAATG